MAKVLVIDDDSQMCQILHDTIELSGHEVAMASNGKDALENFNMDLFSVVVTDIFMPQMGGLKLIKILRKMHSQVKILAISGAGGGAFDTGSVLKYGADVYLNKPFLPTELLQAVNGLISETPDCPAAT